MVVHGSLISRSGVALVIFLFISCSRALHNWFPDVELFSILSGFLVVYALLFLSALMFVWYKFSISRNPKRIAVVLILLAVGVYIYETAVLGITP